MTQMKTLEGPILTGLCWEEVSSPQSDPLLVSPRTPGLTWPTGVSILCVGCHCRKQGVRWSWPSPVYCRDMVEAEVPVAVSGLTDFLRVWGKEEAAFLLPSGPLHCGHCRPSGRCLGYSPLVRLGFLAVRFPSPGEPGQGRMASLDAHSAYGPISSPWTGSVEPQGEADGNLTAPPSPPALVMATLSLHRYL